MRNFIALISACLVAFQALPALEAVPSAASPSAAPCGDALSVISTTWFDIIYPPASADSAALLAEYADGFADEICSLLETSMKGRIPVYLDPSVQVINAYYTPSPYNRIFVYDTTPTDGTLSGFRDNLLMVFYHELTHAVSINIRSGFWQSMSAIFGDMVSVNFLVTMPKSFIEGVTVSFESRHGEGRLNDPLTRHYLTQDKLEGRFLGWKEAAGSLDVYPGAKSAYLYGGAFSAWLQSTWGMEKYAELWKRGGGFNPFLSFIQTRFSQVYGIGIDDAWSRFRDSIAVPEDCRVNPDILRGTGDGVYSALVSGPDGIFWADSNSSGVYFRSSSGTVRRLFDSDSSVHRLSVSPDGRYLLVSGAIVNDRVITQTVRVYDLVSRSFLDETYPNLRDASFAGGSANICGVETISQRASLVLFRRGDSGPRRVLLSAGPGQEFAAVFNPVTAGDEKLACIASNGLDRALLVIDTATGLIREAPLPADVGSIRYLQSARVAGETVLTFSWAAPGALYRYAVYRPESGSLELQEGDLSGGVFYPVADEATRSIVYVASYSGRDALQTIAAGTVGIRVVEGALPSATRSTAGARSASIPPAMPDCHYYNPLPWFLDGFLLPIPASLPVNTGLGTIAPGFLYATGDPTERYTVSVRPAFAAGPFFVDYSAELGVRFPPCLVTVAVFDHLMEGTAGFDPYRDAGTSLSLQREWRLGASWKTLSLNVGGATDWYFPDVESRDSLYSGPSDASAISGHGDILLSLVRAKRIPGFPLFAANRSGAAAGVNGYAGVQLPDNAPSSVAQGKLAFWLPVVPLSFTLSASLADGISFAPDSVYADTSCARQFRAGLTRYVPSFAEYRGTSYESAASDVVAGGTAELGLLSLEIQKGVPLVPLYANRIAAAFGYRGAVFGPGRPDATYLDSLYARGSVDASIVIGLLTDVVLSGVAEYAVPLREGEGRFSFRVVSTIGL